MFPVLDASGATSVVAAPKGENSRFEFELRGWSPTLSGRLQASDKGNPGNRLRLDEDLGVNTQQSFFWPKATLRLAQRHRLSVSYLGMRYSGDKTLTQDFNFAGGVYTAGMRTHTQIDFKEIVAGYQYDYLIGKALMTYVNLQVHYLDFKGEVSTDTSTVKRDFQAPVPTIGTGLRVYPFPWLKLSGEFNVFKMGIAGKKGELLDGQAAMTISPWERFGISLGYRYFRVIAVDTEVDNRVDWLQEGPYASVLVRF
jgi:hypothetical protein